MSAPRRLFWLALATGIALQLLFLWRHAHELTRRPRLQYRALVEELATEAPQDPSLLWHPAVLLHAQPFIGLATIIAVTAWYVWRWRQRHEQVDPRPEWSPWLPRRVASVLYAALAVAILGGALYVAFRQGLLSSAR